MNKLLILSITLLLLSGCASSVKPVAEEPSVYPTMTTLQEILTYDVKNGTALTEWGTFVSCQEGVAASSLTDVLPEQITKCFSLGDLTLAFVSQPNTSIVLPETRAWESEGNVAWSGLLAKPIKGEWEVLYKIPDDDFNPVSLNIQKEGLALDAADDSGAGSGEGTLQRYVYNTAGVVDELLYTWQKEKCTSYYIPETYKYDTVACE